MDKKDLLVLACLRKNARQRLTNLSRETKIPISTIFDRLKLYKQDVIKKHTALIDFSKLGFNARANIAIKVEREQREQLQECLMKKPNVNSLAKINNGYDFLIEVVFRHIKDVEDFMEDIENKFKVKAKEIYYIIDELKREGFLSDPANVDLIK